MKLVQFGLPFGRSHFVGSGNLPNTFIRASWCAAVGLLCLFAASEAQSADCVSPPAGLVAWWPGDGTANDIAGTNNGILHSGATFAPGKVGQAFSFNGTSSYIRIADNPSLHFTSRMTIEAWIYLTSASGYRNIVSKWDWPGVQAQKGFTTAVNPDGGIGFGVCDDGDCSQGPGGESATVLSTSKPPLNQWTHFAATYDGCALRMYVNGVCESQTAYNDGIFPGSGDLLIGAAVAARGQVISPFAGRIDEPAAYNRALSADEIRAIYNAGSAGKCHAPILTSQPRL